MMGESCVCLGSKEIRVFGSFRPWGLEIKSKFSSWACHVKKLMQHYQKHNYLI